MVEVHLWSGLRVHADGQDTVNVEAKNVGEVLTGLARAHPGLAPIIEAGVSVSVDGRVIASSLTHPVSPDSDVWLMQKLKGG